MQSPAVSALHWACYNAYFISRYRLPTLIVFLLLALLVAILGGVNPRGGFGSAWGVFLAVLSLQFLSSGLNMLQLNATVGPYVNNFAKEFTWGTLLLAVMAASRRRDGRK